jgi:hypothetical protein
MVAEPSVPLCSWKKVFAQIKPLPNNCSWGTPIALPLLHIKQESLSNGIVAYVPFKVQLLVFELLILGAKLRKPGGGRNCFRLNPLTQIVDFGGKRLNLALLLSKFLHGA